MQYGEGKVLGILATKTDHEIRKRQAVPVDEGSTTTTTASTTTSTTSTTTQAPSPSVEEPTPGPVTEDVKEDFIYLDKEKGESNSRGLFEQEY